MCRDNYRFMITYKFFFLLLHVEAKAALCKLYFYVDIRLLRERLYEPYYQK